MIQTVIASIITFNCDIQKLEENIVSIIDQVAEVLIIDNGSQNIIYLNNLINKFMTENQFKITIIYNSTNLGVATALNQALTYASNKTYKWLFTLDQDSTCKSNIINEMLYFYESIAQKEKIIIIAPYFFDLNRKVKEKLNNSIEVIITITSGSMTNIILANKIGGYLDKLFIDHVDHEFCLRARKNSLKVIKFAKIGLNHEIGKATIHRLLFFKLSTSNHSSIRSYYFSRNSVYLIKNYFWQNPAWIIGLILRNFVRIVKIVFLEKNRKEKLYKISKGYYDGFINNF